MLKLRLQRVGRKNDPSFRVVATDSKNGPKSGRFIEILGSHDPRKDATKIKADRVGYWMSKGAQVSPTLFNLLVSHKIVDGKKINVLPKKSPIKKEGEEVKEETVVASEAEAPEAKEEVKETVEEVKAEEPKEEPKAPEVKEDVKEEVVEKKEAPEAKEESATDSEKSEETKAE